MVWWRQAGTVIIPGVNSGHLQVKAELQACHACCSPAEAPRPVIELHVNGLWSWEFTTD